MIQQSWCLTTTMYCSYMFAWARVTWECIRLRESAQDHWANTQHLSWARPPHMRDLCRSCHRDESDTRKNPLKIPACCSVQTHTSVRVNHGNNGGPPERATPTEAFEKDKYRRGVCPLLSCYGVVLVFFFCLLGTMSHSDTAQCVAGYSDRCVKPETHRL